MEPTSPDYTALLNKIIEQQAQMLEWFQRFYEIGQQIAPVTIGMALGVLGLGTFCLFLFRGTTL